MIIASNPGSLRFEQMPYYLYKRRGHKHMQTHTHAHTHAHMYANTPTMSGTLALVYFLNLMSVLFNWSKVGKTATQCLVEL